MINVAIPARMASSRLPGKMLMDICGKPAIQRTWERVMSYNDGLNAVILTAHEDIYDAAKAFGARVHMTPEDCANGSHRCQWALMNGIFQDGPIINVQGDSVLLNPDLLDLICHRMTDPMCDRGAIHTLIRQLHTEEEVLTPDLAKVVLDMKHHYALWFSRSPIPYYRGPWNNDLNHHCYYGHIGVYAWMPEVLMDIDFMPNAVYNLSRPHYEDLEMCEWLQQGLKVRCHSVHSAVEVYPELNTQQDHTTITNIMESGDLPLIMQHA